MSVLIVEDDDNDMRLLTYVLDRNNVSYFMAESPEAARVLMETKKGHIRVVCLDLNLGFGHGFEFLSWKSIHEEFKNIPVVVMTNHADLATIKISLIKGADDFMIKPVDLKLFEVILKKRGIIPHRG